MSQRIDRLWAPWRLAYIEKSHKGKKTSKASCPFCIAAKEKASEKTLVLYKAKNYFIVLNKFPYNPYHLMVIPNVHEGDLTKLAPQTWLDINKAAQISLKILKKTLKPHGFNLGMNLGSAAGAGIAPHLHLHILPRWSGDTNFMPLIAETKALPVHNATVYRRLKEEFKHFDSML